MLSAPGVSELDLLSCTSGEPPPRDGLLSGLVSLSKSGPAAALLAKFWETQRLLMGRFAECFEQSRRRDGLIKRGQAA